MKPWLALHQLEQDFELTLIDVLKGEQKSPDFLKVNPLGVVPFLEPETGAGIGESNAMLWYLAEGSYLMPEAAQDRAEALQWMFFEQSKLEPFISPARFFTTIVPALKEERQADIADWQAKAAPGLARLNAHLQDQMFIVKSGYCVADIAVFGYVHVAQEAGIGLSTYPNIQRWIADVENTDRFAPLNSLGAGQRRAA